MGVSMRVYGVLCERVKGECERMYMWLYWCGEGLYENERECVCMGACAWVRVHGCACMCELVRERENS